MKHIIISLFLLAFCLSESFGQGADSESSRFVSRGKFVSLAEVGIAKGNSRQTPSSPFIFHYGMNYSFMDNLSAGLGVGAEYYLETYLPVTANVSWRFGDRRIIPFVTMQAGYLIGLENLREGGYYMVDFAPNYTDIYSEGGWLFNPQAGIIIKLSKDLGITLAAGYRRHTLRYVWDHDYYYAESVVYNRLSLKVGITF
ncbi:MAG: hypothetical protein LBD28_00325 [Tannerellaceae bacterium]|jgi:hypothetical protein|nr:hypothetical protein [Tannerellaceae bacterium]